MKFSRRDMLVSLLGLSAASACRRGSDRVHWDGEFVLENASLGHKLRDGFRPTAEQTVEIPCAILGGGIAGLSAAWELKRAGFESFTLFELAAQPGGTAIGGQSGSLQYPWGAHYLPAPHGNQPDLLELLRQAGSVESKNEADRARYAETHLCADPAERIYFAGTWHQGLYPILGASSDDLEQYKEFYRRIHSLVNFQDKDKRRAFSLPMVNSSDDPQIRKLDDLSMAQWCEANGFSSKRLKWYLNYGCRDDFGGDLESTSAWAGLHYYVARIPPGEKESSEFLTWPQGNQFLVDVMMKSIPTKNLRCNALVLSVEPHSNGRRASVLVHEPRLAKTTRYVAEKVIFALPSFMRKYLIRGFEKLPAYHPEYVPWLTANIHMRDIPVAHGFPLAWDNVIYDSKSLGYVVSTHQIPRHRGETVLTYYLPLSDLNAKAARRRLFSLNYRQACDVIVSELSRCHVGFERLIKRIDIKRWGHAMVRPGPGDINSKARLMAQKAHGPLHFAHSDLSALPLFEEAFSHGVRAAREIGPGVSL